MDLNTWGYPNEVGLLTRCDQMAESVTRVEIDTQVIYDAVSEAIDPLTDKFEEINEHIETAKDEIIANVSENSGCHECCNAITKCDLCNAVNSINKHIDRKLNSYDFDAKFGNINEQINELMNELNNG